MGRLKVVKLAAIVGLVWIAPLGASAIGVNVGGGGGTGVGVGSSGNIGVNTSIGTAGGDVHTNARTNSDIRSDANMNEQRYRERERIKARNNGHANADITADRGTRSFPRPATTLEGSAAADADMDAALNPAGTSGTAGVGAVSRGGAGIDR